MTTLRSSLVRLAYENPDLQLHLLPLLQSTDRTAGFFDFLRRKPFAPPKVKGGLLVSLVQPGNPNGPLKAVFDSVKSRSSGDMLDVAVEDWEVTDEGDTLSIDFISGHKQPNLIYSDADVESSNYAPFFNLALKPLIRDLGNILGVKASGAVELLERMGLTSYRYNLTISLPRGTSRSSYEGTSYAPSPLRVASRYLARR